jgi:hypothetical protein
LWAWPLLLRYPRQDLEPGKSPDHSLNLVRVNCIRLRESAAILTLAEKRLGEVYP